MKRSYTGCLIATDVSRLMQWRHMQCRVKFSTQGGVVMGRQRWDVVLLQPARVLIAVQGEQHHSKPNTRRNSSSSCQAALNDTIARDHAVAAGAIQQGFQVVWLLPSRQSGRTRRWAAVIDQAIGDAAAGRKAKLHIA